MTTKSSAYRTSRQLARPFFRRFSRFRPAGDGYYRIITQHSGKVIAVHGASTDAGARLVQSASGSDDNEFWQAKAIADADW
ncbi:RICIN domain-containing protein [Streptosporangium sp. NBC_01756]|uniref:RICIN domain-containing protein n=1 Tax=Streptosporangium sp. NBC_01756 TaxID=2975950 RepID=UPI002DDA610A|nr:RICIN domain-containing protein [Streptosporangium sp. NBC_01756]WSC86496.1 RICIN domain-containing protein [Streptosporangium sp. NBC_01756]